jgi:hypothetical protein
LYFPAGRKNGDVHELQITGFWLYYCDKLPEMIHGYSECDSSCNVKNDDSSSSSIGILGQYSTAIAIFCGLACGLAVGLIIAVKVNFAPIFTWGLTFAPTVLPAEDFSGNFLAGFFLSSL